MQDSNPGTVTASPGGVARNIAENLARLGAECRLVAAVGADHHGDLLLEQGQAAGIDMRFVLQLEAVQTSTYVSVLDHSGDMLVAINDMSIADELTPDRLQAHEQMLKQARLIIADTNVSEAALDYVAAILIEQPLFVDVVSTVKALRIKPHLRSVHTLKASRSEAEALSKMSARSNKELLEVAGWFHEQGVERIFITLDADGVFYSDGNQHGMEDAGSPTASVSNASGAGDAFVAGIAYAWLQQWPIVKSVRFAVSAATLALSHRATINPGMSLASVNEIYSAQYAQ